MNDVREASTRDRLIAAARVLFAAGGYRGATIREITAAAKANLGAVTYHFGTKRDLYEAVVSGVFDQLASRIEAAADTDAGPAERLSTVVRTLFRFLEEAPDVPHLALHELAAGAGLPPFVAPHLRRNLAAIRQVVDAGVAAGDFRPVDPNLVAFSIISQAVWFAIIGRSLVTIGGIQLDLETLTDRMERHVTELVTRFLAQEAGSS